METPTEPDDPSWWDELVNEVKPQRKPAQLPTPLALQPPAVDQGAWDKSVEQAKISDALGSVHDFGLRIYQETKSYSDRPDSNEPLDAAREKMAWVITNGDKQWGFDRQKYASVASPIEPSAQELSDPAASAAYQSSMKAAREVYLGWKDPTNGAVFLNQRPTPDRSNRKFPGGLPQGVPLSTQSGPYDNSYTKGKVSSPLAWLNTYWPPQ